MEQVNPEAVATTPSRRARLLAKSPKVLHHQRYNFFCPFLRKMFEIEFDSSTGVLATMERKKRKKKKFVLPVIPFGLPIQSKAVQSINQKIAKILALNYALKHFSNLSHPLPMKLRRLQIKLNLPIPSSFPLKTRIPQGGLRVAVVATPPITPLHLYEWDFTKLNGRSDAEISLLSN